MSKFEGEWQVRAYPERGISFGETLEEIGTVIAKDGAPFHSECEARVDDNDNGWGC
jgi:hypothetical protein